MKDFYFGEIFKELGSSCLTLTQFRRAVKTGTNKVQLTEQLNRLLLSTNNQLVLNDGTSYPEFEKLLNKIELSEICAIEIEKRTDINENVNATLACNIFFKNGVLSIRPHWCGYKKIRSDEVISTLLIPIVLNGLLGKLTFDFDGEIVPLPEDSNRLIGLLFKLACYPDQEAMDKYVEKLNIAKSIVENGAVGETAFDRYHYTISKTTFTECGDE